MFIFATMEKIIRHIETLLLRHDYVIVPELGGFVIQSRSSVVSAKSIEPPLSVISFNPLMKTSDGLLAIELSRAEQISFREAVQLITREVEIGNSLLGKSKKLQLGKLGILAGNTDGKIIFTPAASSNFIPSNFGLGTLHIAAIQKTNGEEKRVIQLVLPSRKTMMRYAAVAVVAAGLFFGAPRIDDAYRSFANLNPTSLFDKAETPAENAPIQPVQVQSAEQEPVVQAPEANHHVIVSCMATRRDAEEYSEWLRSLNYQNTRILTPVKTFRIAIDSFSTKEEAISFMQELRKNKPQFADAWVLSE